MDSKKRIIIGYYDRRDQPEYQVFRRVATNFKEDCHFHVGFGDAVAQMHPPGQPIIVFRPDIALSNENDETFKGRINDLEELNKWVQQKCVPLVREITFENAEELTEEGLPFLILFYANDDVESIKDFKAIVETQLQGEKCEFFLRLCRFFTVPEFQITKFAIDFWVPQNNILKNIQFVSDEEVGSVPSFAAP
jgi:endoplasmic reticulum resident protein 44